MLPELEDYDWKEAFAYAGDPTGTNRTAMPIQARFTEGTVSTTPILREDVTEIKHSSNGENDERAWIMVGKVKDGRWFFLCAGCDYTGWDCQAGGTCIVASTYEEVVRWGLGSSDRERFGLALEDPELPTS
jgi:hypothetical protein